MQRIYEPQDLLEAELLCAMLGSEGVEVHLVGRDLLGLLVADAEAERARQLIASYNSASPLPGEVPLQGPDVLIC